MQQQETRSRDPVGPFEHRGVDRIPERERTGTPWTFAALFLGGSFAPGSITWGWLPITLGLGVVDAITSMLVGTLVGLVVIAPLVVIGTRTATNNATSSGAFFGVRGRLIGSVLGLALLLVTAALAIWTAGGILVAVAARLLGTPTGDAALAVAYIVLAGVSIAIARWGYHLLLRVSAVLFGGGVVFATLLLLAFAGDIDLGYAGGQYALGGRWPTWLLSALAFGVGGVMLVATVVGDWSRYVPGH
jgi:purine-cytosine permease-like protein